MLARSLLGLMGGTLAVQSTEGEGSRFALGLPVVLQGEPAHGPDGAERL